MSSENSDEEVVVGIHESGIELQEGLNTSLSRNYCSNCRRKTHSYVTVNRETKVADIVITCSNDSCKCKCRTHYACKRCGLPHPYGSNCNRTEMTSIANIESVKQINEINDQWVRLQSKKQTNMPHLKKYD